MNAVRQGERIGWEQVDPGVRAAVELAAGAPVVAATERIGGFSPGAALRLDLAGGGRRFLKAAAASLHDGAHRLYRTEIEVNSWLPDTGAAPRLLWSCDDGEWVALLFDYVDAETPALPWRPADLDLVRDAVRRVHEALTPCPPEAPPLSHHLGGDFASWRALAAAPPPQLDAWSRRHLDRLAELETGWEAAAEGDTLLHADLRHDNLLLDGNRAWIVDWPWAARGAAWADVVFFAPTVASSGGPPVADLLAGWVPDAPPDRVAAVGAALAGFFTRAATQPPVPGLPYLRAHQAAIGSVSRAWLADLLGWH